MITNFDNFINETNNIDVYNIAIKYLISKYGSERQLTSKSIEQLRKASNKKKRKEILDSFDDRNYTSFIKDNLIEDKDDYELFLLIKQYNISSTTIRPELYNKLIQMNLIK